MMTRRILPIIFAAFLAATIAIAGQEPEIPPNGAPPPLPPAGGANGPQPGPAVKAPGPGERTTESSPTPRKKPGEFLAIGAPADPAAAARGQKIFVANCAFCHGSSARGGNGGPNLVQSVLVLHDKGTGSEIGPVILHGRPAKGMPAFALNDAQIKDIATFLLSRSQGAANRMEYKILNIVTGDPKNGEVYFNAHCATCHSPSGDLAHIAAKFEPVDLQSRFLYPKQHSFPGAPGPPPDPKAEKTVTVTLPSGQSYTGKLDHIDDFSVSLTEPSGEHHAWLFDEEKGIKVDVHDPLAAHAELLSQYSNADMHNVLAYLETLK